MHRMKNKIHSMNMIFVYARIGFFLVVFSFLVPCVKSGNAAMRIKDIAYVKGVRDNQLYGYGLVVGLQGTGDSQIFRVTRQLAVNIFEKLGVLIAEADFLSKNIAAVTVTVNIPAFARPGDKLDVVVSSIGDSKSLEGGVLLQTALQGADNEVYAVAQGPLSIGGYNIEGQSQSVRKNISTTAYISNGAIVEKEIHFSILQDKSISVVLRDPDFTTANRLVEAIHAHYPNAARAIDAAVVTIVPPKEFQSEDAIIRFVASIEELYVKPDSIARVIINERTGTIVAGENVRISTVAVAHGNLSITITEKPEVSQPGAFSSGQTAIVPRTEIQAEEEENKLNIIQEGVTIADVARALNILGVTPRDLISIFQAIKRAGALHAELVIM